MYGKSMTEMHVLSLNQVKYSDYHIEFYRFHVNPSLYSTVILTRITLEVIMQNQHNLKWTMVHYFSSLCDIVCFLFEFEQ